MLQFMSVFSSISLSSPHQDCSPCFFPPCLQIVLFVSLNCSICLYFTAQLMPVCSSVRLSVCRSISHEFIPSLLPVFLFVCLCWYHYSGHQVLFTHSRSCWDVSVSLSVLLLSASVCLFCPSSFFRSLLHTLYWSVCVCLTVYLSVCPLVCLTSLFLSDCQHTHTTHTHTGIHLLLFSQILSQETVVPSCRSERRTGGRLLRSFACAFASAFAPVTTVEVQLISPDNESKGEL